MRKLYALLAGILLTLSLPAHSRTVSPDIANFLFTIDAPNNNVVFINTSSLGDEPGIRKAFWHFGDGSAQQMTPALQGTYHHYASTGTYTVCLRIYRYRPNTNDSVLSAQICKTVVIETLCHANFERIPSGNNNPLLAYFRALPQHNNNRKPARICWTFGDGRDSCINYPENYTGQYVVSHHYNHGGQYEVCINILYYGGCEARKCNLVLIENPDTCHADFERIPSAGNPLRVYFRALPSHNNNKKPQRICWTFGDGRDTCINYPSTFTGQYVTVHNYQHNGSYEVCVNILYSGGCEARNCKHIQVGERPDTCHANFERIPSGNNNPLLAYFRAFPQHNNNRKPARICWTFGDGRDTCINYPENYTGQYVVSHHYNHAGQYEVCINILYYGGCEARKCNLVLIENPDTCHANFERIPSGNNNPLLAYFRALPQHNNNRKPARICWTFGDGRDTCITYAENYTGQYVVSHLYNHSGQYEVCINILYHGGCEARKCDQIVILPPQLNCSVHLFELTPSITSLVRSFLAVPSSTPPSRPERICWHFGDGQDTCIMIDPQHPLPDFLIRHTYPAPGIYRACVSIRFQNGCNAEECKEVVIRPSTNICGGYMTDSLMAPRTLKFKGYSIHNPTDEATGYHWTFGDGGTATGREVTHTYNNAGEYRVCLVINTRSGCETRICNTVRVFGNNEPALHLSPNPVTTLLHAAFISTHTEQVSIKIQNSNGIIVRNYIRNVTVGLNNMDFDLGGLIPGIYSFTLQSPNQLASAIFIKQ